MRRSLVAFSPFILAFILVLLSQCNSEETSPQAESVEPAPAISIDLVSADIKPALAKDGFDEEQMRLAKVIHKRIVDYQQIKNKTYNNKPQPFQAYKETINSGVQFDMLPVKAGSFTWKGEKEGDTLEVTLSPFWMGKTEVTWEEYRPFMRPKINRREDGHVPDELREQIKEQMKNDYHFIARPTLPYISMTFGMARDGHPAISMTQHAANKYCQWLSYQTGHFYRLPTEAEWEYACRAGSKTKYPWGDKSEDADQYAWFGGDEASHYHKPGEKKPNAWGFLDMQGNVQEWTLDQYVSNRRAYFSKGKVNDPWVKATKPYPHVIKGGYWKLKLEDILPATRSQSSLKWQGGSTPKSIWYHCCPWIGMRVVRPAKIPTALEMYHYWNSGVEAHEE